MFSTHAASRRLPNLALAALTAAGIVASASAADAATWFVDGRNGGSHNSGSAASPFIYMWQAMQVVQPGDTVYVLPTVIYPQMAITKSGTPSAPISIIGAGAAPSRTRVSGQSTSSAIWINANYVTVQNFDATTTGPDPAILLSQNHHHVTIASNVAHGAGGNGISTFTDDYVTISHNIVYGNAWNTTKAFNSGISMLGNLDIDGNTGVKMIVDGNVVYNNTNTPSNCTTQACLSTWTDSDGSGIIVDNSQRTRFDQIPYNGRTQISNNVVFGNGGRGVHVYLSDHVTVTGNTMYSNNQDPYESLYHPGEVSAVNSGDVQVYNNILYSDGKNSRSSGSAPNYHVGVSFEYCTDGTGPMVAKYNLIFNPQNVASYASYVDSVTTNPTTIANNLWAGAAFENPTIAYPGAADFRVKPTSMALRHGNPATSVNMDMMGKNRLVPPSIGAYQVAGP